MNLYLIEKYNIEISDDMEQRIDDKIKEVIKRKAIDKNQKFENILPVNKVDMFIEKMSDIDIDLYSKNELNKNDSQLLEVNLLNQLKLAKRVNLFDYSLEELQAVHEYWRSMNRYSKQVLNKEKVA